MIRQLAPERPAALQYAADEPSPTGLVAAAAAIRGLAVAASGLILAAGLALVLWAVTPSSGAEVGVAVQGGVVAFAAANLMPVLIGGVTLTLPPLLFTLAIAALFASTARRGRFLPQGRYQETVSILVTGVVYGLVVAATTRGLGPPDAVPAGWVWTAAALALVSTTAGMLRRGSAWHQWWVDSVPDWARLGVRGGGIGLGVMIAGGGIALSAGLVAHFGSAVSVAALAAPSWLDGLGLAVLGIAYVPNAVIAAAGYVSGVGFEMGPGTYSPFATSTVDLPAVPLLAAAPDQAGRSWIGLAFLVVPAVAGYLIARPAIKNLGTRADRVLASAVGAVLSGALLAAAAAVAGGGVGDGRWSTFGAPPALLGAVVAVEIGAVAMVVAGLSGGGSIPWRLPSEPSADEVAPAKKRKPSRSAGTRTQRKNAATRSASVSTETDDVQEDVVGDGQDDDDRELDAENQDELAADDGDLLDDDPIDDDLTADDPIDDDPIDDDPSEDAVADDKLADGDPAESSDSGPADKGTRNP